MRSSEMNKAADERRSRRDNIKTHTYSSLKTLRLQLHIQSKLKKTEQNSGQDQYRDPAKYWHTR